MTVRILEGDVRARLADVPEQSVQCCVTSPPYYGLRDYGVSGQIGLEPTLAEYIATMVAVFRDVRRVLRDDGTFWLNIGDSYAANGGVATSEDRNKYRSASLTGGSLPGAGRGRIDRGAGLKPKDLMMVPARLALALQEPHRVPSIVSDERDRAWLAAMFDGEGTIGIRRFHSYRDEVKQEYQDGFVVYTSVTNNDVPLIDRCVDLTGKGSAKVKQRADITDGRGITSRFDSYGWRLDGNAAVDVIRAIYPYLIVKRKQAVLAYTLDVLNKRGRELRGNGPVPADEQAKRALLYDLIKRANQREAIDIPSWCEEPTEKIEPGWYLRSDIIWKKPNPMPESVTDRPTSAHEHIFLLTKQPRYYYDADAIREANAREWDPTNNGAFTHQSGEYDGKILGRATMPHSGLGNAHPNPAGRNCRNVWSIATMPYKEAHFATFPPEIPRRCIKAGSKPGDTILDPFAGAGTTLLVADQLGRDAVGIELNPTYAALIELRLKENAPMFVSIERVAVSEQVALL